jgi:hypothetical protein
MRICKLLCAVSTGLAVLGTCSGSEAQTFENVGVRAQGMGGAFVAVADDATASWWNPAGLATGAYLSAVVERGRLTEPSVPAAAGPASRVTAGNFAVAFPALGLSYYRFRVSEVAPPGSTGEVSGDRQDPGTGGTGVRTRAVSQFGVTVGQSVGRHLVFGSTLKLVRAGELYVGQSGTDVSLDMADELEVEQKTRADLDIGAMANFGHVRVGATLRNLTEPAFGEGSDRLRLGRKARVGVAVLSVPNGLSRGITVSGDADLTTTPTVFGDVRHVAAGGEAWIRGRLGVRAGVSANTIGERRPAGSVGASVALTRAIYVNASKTAGQDDSVTGWSTSVSVAF